jgi:hypothetical protein
MQTQIIRDRVADEHTPTSMREEPQLTHMCCQNSPFACTRDRGHTVVYNPADILKASKPWELNGAVTHVRVLSLCSPKVGSAARPNAG